MIGKAIRTEGDIMNSVSDMLSDDFLVYGDDASLFAKTQKYITDNTHAEEVLLDNIQILSVLPENEQTDPDFIRVYSLSPGGISEDFHQISRLWEASNDAKATGEERKKNLQKLLSKLSILRTLKISRKSFIPKEDGKQVESRVLPELMNSRLLFRNMVDGKAYIVSDFALPTLCQRIEAAGAAMLSPSLERDMFFSRKFRKGGICQLMIKQQHGIGKVFMAASERYCFIPMHIITDLYRLFEGEDGIGTMKCEGWEINHSYSRIRFAFEEQEKIEEVAMIYGLDDEQLPTPCIEIISSDIGDSAFRVRGYWKVRSGRLYTEEVAKKHSGNIEAEEFIKEVRRNIFDKYTLLPDRFIELLDIDITQPQTRSAIMKCKNAQNIYTGILAKVKQAADPDSNDNTEEEKDNSEAKRAARQELKEAEKSLAEAKKELKEAEKYQGILDDEMIDRIIKKLGPATPNIKNAYRDHVKKGIEELSVVTAYDLFVLFIDAQQFSVNTESVEKMRKAMKELPYLDYGKMASDIIEQFSLFRQTGT